MTARTAIMSALFILLLTDLPTHADKVHGLVWDGARPRHEQPIAAVVIECRSPEGGVRKKDFSDARGSFVCSDLPAGPVEVTYRRTGYLPKGLLTVELDGEAHLDLDMYKVPKGSSAEIEGYWIKVGRQFANGDIPSYVQRLRRLQRYGVDDKYLIAIADDLAASLDSGPRQLFTSEIIALGINIPEMLPETPGIGPPTPNGVDDQDQVAAAVLSGRITFEGGALPGVVVTVTGQDLTRTAFTDSEGAYRIHLAPGTYDVTFSLEGFSTTSRSSVFIEESTDLSLDFGESTMIVPDVY